MSRARFVLLAVGGLSLAACDVKVNQPTQPPVVVEKKTTTIIHEKPEPAPVEIHVNDKK